MKKTLAALTILGVAVALPAFAADATTTTTTTKHYRHHAHPVAQQTSTQQSTYSEHVTYHKVRVPLTPEEVTERQHMITKIERDIKKVDYDNNHQISFEEYTAGEQRLHTDGKEITESFKSIDANSDGQLSSQEIQDSQWAQIEHTKFHHPVVATTSTTEETTYINR